MSSFDVNSKHVEMNHHTIYISRVKLILLVIFYPVMKVIIIFLVEELKHILRDISKRKSLPLDVTLLEFNVFGSMEHILENPGIDER